MSEPDLEFEYEDVFAGCRVRLFKRGDIYTGDIALLPLYIEINSLGDLDDAKDDVLLTMKRFYERMLDEVTERAAARRISF